MVKVSILSASAGRTLLSWRLVSVLPSGWLAARAPRAWAFLGCLDKLSSVRRICAVAVRLGAVVRSGCVTTGGAGDLAILRFYVFPLCCCLVITVSDRAGWSAFSAACAVRFLTFTRSRSRQLTLRFSLLFLSDAGLSRGCARKLSQVVFGVLLKVLCPTLVIARWASRATAVFLG